MKRVDLLRYLNQQGCELFREGGRHTVYWNPANRKTTAVPRHTEILEQVVASICKDLGVPRPGQRH